MFDFPWIAGLVLSNLHWVFALAAFVVISHNGKRSIWQFLIIVAMLYAIVDIGHIGGWIFAPLIIFVPLNFIITLFTESPALLKYQLKIIIFAFFLLAFINTFYFSFLW